MSISARKHGKAQRVFFAAPLPEELACALAEYSAALRETKDGAGIRWTPKENLHMTLHFVGNFAASQTQALRCAVQQQLAGASAFALQCGAPALLPKRKPRTLVLPCAPLAPAAELAARVAAGVAQCKAAAGDEADAKPAETSADETGMKRFYPHITIGRLRAHRAPQPEAPAAAQQLQAVQALRWQVAQVVLFRSEIAEHGAQYRALSTIPLAAAGAAAAGA